MRLEVRLKQKKQIERAKREAARGDAHGEELEPGRTMEQAVKKLQKRHCSPGPRIRTTCRVQDLVSSFAMAAPLPGGFESLTLSVGRCCSGSRKMPLMQLGLRSALSFSRRTLERVRPADGSPIGCRRAMASSITRRPRTTGAWHAAGEAAIRASGVGFVFVQPSGFMATSSTGPHRSNRSGSSGPPRKTAKFLSFTPTTSPMSRSRA